MATPVVTVASGGLPVVDVTATSPKLGLPVTEALNGRGMAVTKVAARGMPVTFSTVADYPPTAAAPGAEATAWLARNPGLAAMYVAADTDFINGMVADGIWSKFDYLHIYATESLTVGNRNMVSASYPSSVSAATFTVNRGLLNSGSDHIGAGLIPSAATSLLTLNSAHISMWSNTNTTGPSGWTMGVHSGSYLAITPDWSGTAGAGMNDGTGFTNANTGTLGHFLGNRSASNAVQFYKNGALHGSSTNASTSLPTLEIWSLACNENGFPNISPFQLCADSAGSSLTAAEALKFYNRLRTRLTAVGVP